VPRKITEKMPEIRNKNFPESELTEKIIGCAFEVYKRLGHGIPEKIYQNAFAEMLSENNLNFRREKYGKIKFHDKIVGRYFLDFFVENKVAVELKARNDIFRNDVNQLLGYMKSEDVKLGLLIVFTRDGARVKRLIN